jgi:hypothetical protein
MKKSKRKQPQTKVEKIVLMGDLGRILRQERQQACAPKINQSEKNLKKERACVLFFSTEIHARADIRIYTRFAV